MRLFDPGQLQAYRGLFGNRDFRRWFWSSLWSSFGDWVGLFALQVVVVSVADAGSRLALFGLGAIMMARLLPSVVLGPFVGVIADRYNRKQLMLACDVSRAALFAVIAFRRELWALLLLTVAVEVLSLLYLSAKNAALPELVERTRLAEANQLTLLITYGPLPFGAAAAAVLTWLSGVLDRLDVAAIDANTAALLLNALTFLVGAALIVRLRSIAGSRDRGDGADTAGVRAQLRDAVLAIGERPLVRSLILGVIGVFFGAGVLIALGPEFVRAELGRTENDWYGLMTVVGFGLLAGIVAAPALTSRLDQAKVFSTGLVAAAAVALVVATTDSFLLAEIVGFWLGAFAGLSFVTGYTILHVETDDETRGRVFAAFFTGTRISMFAALGLGPFLAGAIGRFTVGAGAAELTVSGVRVTLLAGGAVALCSAAVSARWMFRHRRGGEDG